MWDLNYQISSVQFSHSVVSNSLRPRESQHAGPPCSSPTPRAHSDSHPLSQWFHPALSSSIVPLLLLPPIPPSIRVFSNESTLPMRWSKYWSFNFSIIPSKEIPWLIFFRMDWLDLLAVQGTLKSLLQHHSPNASRWRLNEIAQVNDLAQSTYLLSYLRNIKTWADVTHFTSFLCFSFAWFVLRY